MPDLSHLPMKDLRQLAKQNNINSFGMNRAELQGMVQGSLSGIMPTPLPVEAEGVSLTHEQIQLCYACLMSNTNHAETHTMSASKIDARHVRLSIPSPQGGSIRLRVTLPECLRLPAEEMD